MNTNKENPNTTVEEEPVPDSVKVTWTGQRANIAQIFASGLEYAFLSSKGEQCHQMVLCPEFLLEAVDSTVNSRSVSLYGFNYNAVKQAKVDLDRLRLIIGNATDSDFANKIPAILDVLNQAETRLDLRLTVAQKVTNPEKGYENGEFVLVGSPRWLESPPMLSLYTLLIRAGCVHTIGTPFLETIKGIAKGKIAEYQHYDEESCEKALPAIKMIMTIGYRPLFLKDISKNYPSNSDAPTLHHYATIMAVGSKESGVVVKHWTRDELKNKPTLDDRRKAKAEALALAGEGEHV